MTWEAGAAGGEMTMELIFGIPSGDTIPELHETFRQPRVMVDLEGERSMDEGVPNNAACAQGHDPILPGSTMGFAISSGRIAGEEAVRYAQSLNG